MASLKRQAAHAEHAEYPAARRLVAAGHKHALSRLRQGFGRPVLETRSSDRKALPAGKRCTPIKTYLTLEQPDAVQDISIALYSYHRTTI